MIEFGFHHKNSKIFANLPLKFMLSTRAGGNSNPPFDTLNLGRNTKDSNVETNIELLKKNLGIQKLHFLNQTHSNKILTLYKDSSECIGEGDGILTNERNCYAMIIVADCSISLKIKGVYINDNIFINGEGSSKEWIIPIINCFDDNYTLSAAIISFNAKTCKSK